MRLVCGAKVRGVRRLGVLAAVQDIVALNLLRGAAKPVLGSLPFFTIIIQIILQGVAIHREHVAGLHESPSLSILPAAFVCVAPSVVLRSVIFLVLIY